LLLQIVLEGCVFIQLQNFGTWDEYVDLVQAAHKRGIYVVQDIVINHQCGCNTLYVRPATDHESCTATLDAQFWQGSPVGANTTQGQLAFSDTFFGPLKSAYFFNRCGANSAGDTSGTGPSAVYGDFVSTMLDYCTPNYNFQNIFTELFKAFVGAADVDGFRLDAAKHVTEDFVAHFSTNMRAYAKSLGKSDFIIVGEVAAPSDWIGLVRMVVFTLNNGCVCFDALYYEDEGLGEWRFV
jgi:glycosidase